MIGSYCVMQTSVWPVLHWIPANPGVVRKICRKFLRISYSLLKDLQDYLGVNSGNGTVSLASDCECRDLGAVGHAVTDAGIGRLLGSDFPAPAGLPESPSGSVGI